MKTQDLRALVVLSEELHFGRAATRLGIFQPVLSEVVKRIESQSGVTIFARRPKVTMTGEGRALVEGARRALWQIDNAIQQARLIAVGSAGVVRVGLISAAMVTSIPLRFRQFTLDNPGVTFDLSEAPTHFLRERLQRGELDLMVGRPTPGSGFSGSMLIVPDQVEIIVPAHHWAASLPQVALAQFSSENFIFFPRSSGPAYYDQLMQACHTAGLFPTVTQEVESLGANLALVRAGFGVALGTASLRGAGFPDIAFCRVSDPMPDVSLYLTYNRDDASPLLHRLAKALEGGGAHGEFVEPVR